MATEPDAESVPEYRIEQLAAISGTTVRTLQSYRNKGLLPPPRRSGRVVLFTDVHVERLAVIADLISRGYSLGAIGELFDGLDRGERIHDLVGLDSELARTPEPVVVTPRQVAEEIHDGIEGLERALGIGMFDPVDPDYDGNPADEPLVVLLPEVLRAGAAMVEAGIPPRAIIEEGVNLRRDADAMAARLTRLAVDHLMADHDGTGTTVSGQSVSKLVLRLMPYASSAVAELIEAAMRAEVHRFVDEQIAELLTPTDADER